MYLGVFEGLWEVHWGYLGYLGCILVAFGGIWDLGCISAVFGVRVEGVCGVCLGIWGGVWVWSGVFGRYVLVPFWVRPAESACGSEPRLGGSAARLSGRLFSKALLEGSSRRLSSKAPSKAP